jgi:hypothetical protein
MTLRSINRRPTAARLLSLRVRISPRARVSGECCVLSGSLLRRANHSCRGDLLSVACLSVISKH